MPAPLSIARRTFGRALGRFLALLVLSSLSSGCAYYRLELRGESLETADVIVVPGVELDEDGKGNWMLWNRMLKARILLEEGRGRRILVTGGMPVSGVTEARKMLEFGYRLGIPHELVILEERASSSVENGRFSADMLADLGYSSGLIVSDRLHLTYAVPVFRDAFEARGLELYWTAVDYGSLESSADFCQPGESPEDPRNWAPPAAQIYALD